jgi:DNA-binding NarL/FixJ family response regulator
VKFIRLAMPGTNFFPFHGHWAQACWPLNMAKRFSSLNVQFQDVILRHMAEGLSRPQVARTLCISERGLGYHWNGIVERFKTRSEFKIALRAKQAGII